LEDTELLGFGSRKSFKKHFVFKNGISDSLNQELDDRRSEFRKNSVGFGTVESRKRGIGNMLDEMTSYLSLVGFVALLLGGVGIAGAVQVYLKEKAESMAVLRCLGCQARTSMFVFCIQITIIGFIGCLLGA
ncbi:MAG: FtsX-like permease family protein, partial [Verrucomicrobiia bacterium]